MPFTDIQLATQMEADLVASGIMTAAEQQAFWGDTSENAVAAALTPVQLGNFANYWIALGAWIALPAQGGNIATMTGLNVQGRQGGNPAGVGLRAIYNDAFNDVNNHIGTPGFLPVKAISNQLRFVSFILDY